MKVPLPRVNKRSSSSAAAASALLPLYHSASLFLPLAPAALVPAVSHAFAALPQSSHGSHAPSPTPIELREVLHATRLIRTNAQRYALHQPGVPAPSLRALNSTALDINGSRNDRAADAGAIAFLRQSGDGPTLVESAEMGWRYGDEPPLRRRARLVAERLCGTVAGGRVGEHTLAAKGPDVQDFLAAERTRRAAEAADPEEGFGDAFGDDGEAESRT